MTLEVWKVVQIRTLDALISPDSVHSTHPPTSSPRSAAISNSTEFPHSSCRWFLENAVKFMTITSSTHFYDTQIPLGQRLSESLDTPPPPSFLIQMLLHGGKKKSLIARMVFVCSYLTRTEMGTEMDVDTPAKLWQRWMTNPRCARQSAQRTTLCVASKSCSEQIFTVYFKITPVFTTPAANTYNTPYPFLLTCQSRKDWEKKEWVDALEMIFYMHLPARLQWLYVILQI